MKKEPGPGLLIFLLLCWSLITGAIGADIMDRAWQQQLADQRLYEWRIDPKTGDREFVPVKPSEPSK